MDVSGEMAATGLRRETLERLVETYGRSYVRVLDLARKLPEGDERLCPRNPEIVAQLHYAVAEELTISLQDFLLRRTGIGTSPCQGLDCAGHIAARMADLLGWNPRRREAELAAFHDQVNQSHRFRQT
jgi:glycerol-3-phosphate dehydrogenase